ncbi:hypothetical protein [Xanthomonas sp. F1]
MAMRVKQTTCSRTSRIRTDRQAVAALGGDDRHVRRGQRMHRTQRLAAVFDPHALGHSAHRRRQSGVDHDPVGQFRELAQGDHVQRADVIADPPPMRDTHLARLGASNSDAKSNAGAASAATGVTGNARRG